jgi:hypothetical protein
MMSNSSAKGALSAIIAVTLILIGAAFTVPILAIKKSSSIITDREWFTTVASTTTHHQIKGVKILDVHTLPSTVVVGSTFSIRGTVINNSTSTITFTNGTCNSPVSIDFNKNVMIENQGAASCTALIPDVTLKPGEGSSILYPYHSGIVYRATAPGMTNATISFSYGVETPTGKSTISDNISRLYTFNIQSTSQGNSSQSISKPNTTGYIVFSPPAAGAIGSSSGGLLSIKYPDQNLDVPAGTLIAVGGTSAPSNATHINCNVAVQINQHGFVQASPHGPKGAGDYTKWTAITTTPTQQGLNQIEAQLLCFPPGKVSTPNLIKHLVHNVTGLPVAGLPTAAQSPSTHLAPPSKEAVPSTAVAPSTPKKIQTGQQLRPTPLKPHL